MNSTVYWTLMGVTALLAFALIVLATVTGKGDAMSSGGGGIRTSFRGKDSIEDQIARVVLYTGMAFMGMCLLLDFMSTRVNFNK